MLTFCRDLGDEVVKVFVGSSRKLFQVHKKPLCRSSEFFDKAFNGGFAEAQDNKIDLPEDSPEIFAVFVRLLYTGRIVDHRSGTDELIDV